MMLDGLRVVELIGADIWGAAAVGHCGRILADLGADVVKAEPPEGDPVRRVPPFVGAGDAAARGLLWISLNANQKSGILAAGEPPTRAPLVGAPGHVPQAAARRGAPGGRA